MKEAVHFAGVDSKYYKNEEDEPPLSGKRELFIYMNNINQTKEERKTIVLTGAERVSVFSDNTSRTIAESWKISGYEPLKLATPVDIVNPKDLSMVIKERSEKIEKEGEIMLNYFKDVWGNEDERVKAFSAVHAISPFLNQIAASQMEKFNPSEPEAKPWIWYNREAVRGLKDKIASFLGNGTYLEFFNNNPEFKNQLEIISKRLVDESEFDRVLETYKEIEALSKSAQKNKRKFNMIIGMDDYYTDPNRKEEQKPRISEADMQLWFTPDKEIADGFGHLVVDAQSRMANLFNTQIYGNGALYGYFVYGAGDENLSATIGEAGLTRNFSLALNLIQKSKPAWEKTKKLFNHKGNIDFVEIENTLAYYFLLHEWGHGFSRDHIEKDANNTRILDELATDAPSLVALLDKIKETGGDGRVVNGLVQTLVHSFSFEDAITAESGSDVAMGYKVCTRLVLGQLEKAGIIKKQVPENEKLELEISADMNKLNRFQDAMDNVHQRFLTGESLEGIKRVRATPLVQEIVDYYKAP